MREYSRTTPPCYHNTPPSIILNIRSAFCQRFSKKENENNVFYNGDEVIIIARDKIIVDKIITKHRDEPRRKRIGDIEVIYFSEGVVKEIFEVIEEIRNGRQFFDPIEELLAEISHTTNRARFVLKSRTDIFDDFSYSDEHFEDLTFVSLDSVKLSIPRKYVSFNKSFFEHISYEKAQYEKFFVKPNIRGLKLIEVKENEVIIEASAKILDDDYYEGLSLKTLREFFDKLNETGIININEHGIAETSVLRCDVTDNVKLKSKSELKSYLRALSLIENEKYIKRVYRDSVVFEKNVKTYKERIILYDKAEELKKDKNANRKWLKDFENVLRVEQNITSFDRIRAAFEVETTNLIDVLSSLSRPNAKLLQKIIEGAKRRENLEDLRNAKMLKEYCFLRYLNEHYSIADAKRLLLKSMSRSTAYKYIAQLRSLRIRESLEQKLQEIINYLYEVKK